MRASFVARGPAAITLRALDLVTTSGWTYKGGNPGLASRLIENRPVIQRFDVTVPAGALPTRSLLTRESPDVPRYRPAGPERHKPWTAPPVLVRAEYEFDHTIVEVTGPVQRREADAALRLRDARTDASCPPLTLNVTPAQAIIALGGGSQKPIPVTVDITNNNQSRESSGTARDRAAAGLARRSGDARVQTGRGSADTRHVFSLGAHREAGDLSPRRDRDSRWPDLQRRV